MGSRQVEEYFQNPRKIAGVDTDDQYNLILTFDNGEMKIYSMRDHLTGVFSILQDKKRFQAAFLDEFGNVAWNIDETIDSSQHWNNRIDICKDALYMDSIPLDQTD